MSELRFILIFGYCHISLYSLLGKPSRLEHTLYIDRCCTQLLQDQEYSTDSLLVYLIRIQQIAIKINDTFWKKSEFTRDGPFQDVHALAIAVVKKELDVFMDHLPEFLKSNCTRPDLAKPSSC